MKTPFTEDELKRLAEAPDLRGFDVAALDQLAAYPDGSGGGVRGIKWEMSKIREERERLDLLEAFIRKYQLTLGALSWSASATRTHPTKKCGQSNDLAVFVPEIELRAHAYNQQRCVTAMDVAKLWPEAQWRRTMPRFEMDAETRRDWTADVDGVLLRIVEAECKPKPKKVDAFPPCGPVHVLKGGPVTLNHEL